MCPMIEKNNSKKSEIFSTISVDNYYTKLIVFYVLFSLIFMVYAWRKNEAVEHAKVSMNIFERFSAAIEEKLQKYFSKWGCFCASNPFAVLTIGKKIKHFKYSM